MPTLQVIRGCSIEMYFNDHPPPHFHIIGGGFEAVVEIGSWRVIRSDGKRTRIDDIMDWARDHEAVLRDTWQELRRR